MTDTKISRLREFVGQLSLLIEKNLPETELLAQGSALLADLVAHDDWLPEAFAQPHPTYYQQYLLAADPQQRFSVVSFVWGPGQQTPIHDHRVWGLVGVLRGREINEPFTRDAEGRLQAAGVPAILQPGQVTFLSPATGDIHRVSNALSDQVSISIHVYGGNIGAISRAVFPESGGSKPFISGYSNTVVPNLYDLSGSKV